MWRSSAGSGGRFPIPAWLNACILVAQLAAIVACLVLARRVEGGWGVTGLVVGFGVLMNSVYSTIHEAEHGMLFPAKWANESAGVLMSLWFPAPFHLLRQGHLGHHMRNRSDDEAFDLYFDGDNVVWRYMVWYGILTGMYYLVVVLANVIGAVCPFVFDRRHFRIERHVSVDRASAAFFEAFNPRYVAMIWAESVAAIALHIGVVWGMGVPVGRYLATYAAFGFMWSAMQYVHHFGTERHVTRGARNLRLFEPLDVLLLNHNWHLAHHEHPTVPWVHLPGLGREEAPDPRRGFLPWYYLRMWRGPRKTDERVENKYAGKVIQ